ncbi:hypothetical protein [Listeria welshimeri]|uniref:hypothetical protein n=1 Tax=Listeria welshimeri TaxID=1643 RepID=UPI001E64C8CE|nr:hypothetical protein [Listeria welshimeri]
MKDINYQEDDWREAKSALAPFAAANWMGGLFNNLVKVAENMEEAEADIQELDSDGAISFQHTNHTGKYSTIEEDLLVLYKFCCHAGERMENLVNLPFYEKLDAFVGGMQELSISTYATTNRMEVKEQRTVTTGEYAQSFETIKAEVTMEDLLNGDNFYANQMQLQYRDWKRANPDQDVSEADFKMSMIHTRAFEYKSIKNEQEEKEFWVSIVATVGIIAVSVLCPPAGLALSVAYGGLEISSAVSGKDWFSGRELSTGERYTRAGFGVLDVIPGVKAFTTGAKAVGTGSKLLRLGDNVLADSKNIGRLAKGTMGEGLQAGKQAMHLRLSNAQKIAQQAGANVQRKLAKDWNDLGAAAKAIQGKAKQAIPLAPRERLALAGAGGSIPEQSVAGASAAATKKKLQEMMQKMDNLNVKGSGKDDIIKGASGLNGFKINEIRPQLKTEPDTAFFWSGRTDGVGGADIAADVAKFKGGVTLESMIDANNIKMPEWDFNKPDSMKAWDLASASYAEQVSGEVRAVIGSELRKGNIWENVELPRLKDNPKVSKITTIDPKTGIEKIIFERNLLQ